jgi:hypothetical protein
MKKIIILLFIIILISFFSLLYLAELFPFWKDGLELQSNQNSQSKLKVYPIDKFVEFHKASSRLTFHPKKGNDRYKIMLFTNSETNTPAFIRQDISLIYSNGVLIGLLYGGKENLAFFEQHISIKGEGSARYDVLTYHHAEIHHSENEVTSQHAMSQDQAYILSSAFSSSSFFREAKTNTQSHWKRILDYAILEQWTYQWNYLIEYFKIEHGHYEIIPFTQLPVYQTTPFPHFSQAETDKIIGRIWEGIYRHYVLGLNNSLDKPLYQEGSTLPVLLLAKDRSHLKILFRASEGKEVQLIQQIHSN